MSTKRMRIVDESQRVEVRNNLTSSMVVDAGAGTGKTTLLIDRLISLIHLFDIDKLAAITFTEKAAAELADRLRRQLEYEVVRSGDIAGSMRLIKALSDIDQAQLSTIHSFAVRIVRDKAFDVGIDPEFSHIDPHDETVLLKTILQEELFSDHPERDKWLRQYIALDGGLEKINELCQQLFEQRDLLECLQPASESIDPGAVLAEFDSELSSLGDHGDQYCKNPEDGAYSQVKNLLQWRESVDVGDEQTFWWWIKKIASLKLNRGSQKNWSEPSHCKFQKDSIRALRENAQKTLDHARRCVLVRLVEWLDEVIKKTQEYKIANGNIGFQDQLLIARRLLDNSDTLGMLQDCYESILIDEFQDTDPLQVEIVLLLAADKPKPVEIGDLTIRPGKICVVGDPKQSIYRFRRADPEIYKHAVQKIHQFGKTVNIVQNFRSNGGIVRFVNTFFDQLWDKVSGAVVPYQFIEPDPEYPDPEPCPPVVELIPRDDLDLSGSKVDDLRSMEANAICQIIQSDILAREWQVVGRRDNGQLKKMNAKYDDIAVLFPTTTGIDIYTSAFIEWNIPFQVEGGKKFFGQSIVCQLYSCIAAIDNPLDNLAVISAMRSVFFGVSDSELVQWRLADNGKYDYRNQDIELPPGLSDALGVLRNLHDARKSLSIRCLIEELLERTCALQVLRTQRNSLNDLSSIQRILNHAHRFDVEKGTGLRDFKRWLEQQIIDENDDKGSVSRTDASNCVRLMTIHSAKGLEFPIVILANLNKRDKSDFKIIPDRLNKRLEIAFNSKAHGKFQTAGFEEAIETEREAQTAEKMRLLYVAMTRARDHLVIPRFSNEGKQGILSTWVDDFFTSQTSNTNKDKNLWRTAIFDPREKPTRPKVSATDIIVDAAGVLREQEALQQERDTRLQHALDSLPRIIQPSLRASDTDFEHHAAPIAEHSDNAVRIGRAFHSYMSICDLTTSLSQDLLVFCASREGLDSTDLENLVRNCLASDLWGEAISARRMWREAPVVLKVPEGLMRGSIDLVWEDSGHLVHIFDYKTGEPEPERHFPQMHSYIKAFQRTTGFEVASARLFFARQNLTESVPLD